MRAFKAENEIKITESYLYRESIREIVGRRYSADEKAWYIPLTDKNIAFIQLLGAEIDYELKKVVRANSTQGKNSHLAIQMPIRAAPYAHQIDAFNFAMKIYGITGGDDAKEVVRNDIQQGT